MNRIGKVLKSWASHEVDAGRYEYVGVGTGETWQIRLKESEPARTLHVVSYETVSEILAPYLPAIWEVDGWGHPLQFAIHRELRGEGVFAIRSPGRDGRFDTDSYMPGQFDAEDLDGDIVAVDGYYFRWPRHRPETVVVTVRASLPDFALLPGREAGEGTLRIRRSGHTSEAARAPVSIPGQTSVELEKAENWRFEVDSEQYWHEGTYVKELSDEILLVIYPLIDLRGRFEAPNGVALPTEIYLTFRARGVDPKTRIPFHSVDCPVTDQTWSCRVPASLWDARILIPGFASAFFSGLDLRGATDRDLGVLSLSSGCSVYGWVRTSHGEPLPSGVRVDLMPLQQGDRRSNTVGKLQDLVPKKGTEPVVHRVDERGLFQFKGLVEGETYSITPKKEGWSGLEYVFLTEGLMCKEEAEVILHLSREAWP